MSYGVWLSFFSYTIVTALSPGPNNILALNSTGNLGLKQSRKLLFGIYTGFLGVMAVCGVFSTVLVAMLPNILIYMKYLGVAYIVWLAYHVVISKPLEVTENENSPSFWKGFILQFVNVKIILWGITVFTSFVLTNYHSSISILGFILLLSLIGNGATYIWAVTGSAFSDLLKKYFRVSNIVMAALLLYSAVKLIFS
ncbi:LysE family transporter [Heyndrickxia sp. NPDC080065]|uniref:LysE family transporter n=1 Tax=Heyndrickxia sp. NPDC080065 TaxID=3390568 RepID=UPI003D029B5C